MSQALPRSLVIFLLSLFSALPAGAEGRGNTPEIFYQPVAGGFAASLANYFYTPNVKRVRASNGTTVATEEVAANGTRAQFHYALNEAWAAQISVASESQEIKLTDPFGSINLKANGLRDPKLRLTNLSALGSWTLYVALGFDLSLEKHNEAAFGRAGNFSSGGHSVLSALGLSSAIGSGDHIGFKLDYLTRMDRVANANTGSSSDYSISGGNEFSVRGFYEIGWSPIAVDLRAGYDFIDPESLRYADGSQASHDAIRSLVISVGAQVQFLSAFNLRADYETVMVGERRTTSIVYEATNQSTAQVRLRYEF